MSLPTLSVVVPCYNAEDTLGEQLRALALAGNRWAGEWEVIVSDNGSTDRSREVAESFHGELPRLRIVDAGGSPGPGHSRNVGAAAAGGEALLFCDADDRVDPGWIDAMGRALVEHEFVASRYETEELNPGWAARRHPQETGLNPYDYPPYLPHAGGGGLGVRRRLHEEIGGFNEDLPALEDTDYCWRLQHAGVEMVYVPEAVVHIRFRRGLRGIFRQNYLYGRYNVLIYKRYRPLGMPRLSPWAGPLRWAKLLVTWPKIFLSSTRAGWIAQLGWRLGRLDGCVRYRVWAL